MYYDAWVGKRRFVLGGWFPVPFVLQWLRPMDRLSQCCLVAHNFSRGGGVSKVEVCQARYHLGGRGAVVRQYSLGQCYLGHIKFTSFVCSYSAYTKRCHVEFWVKSVRAELRSGSLHVNNKAIFKVYLLNLLVLFVLSKSDC